MKKLTEKVEQLEIALLEKKYDWALATLVEIFAVIVSLQAGSPAPSIRWYPAKTGEPIKARRRTDNDLICDVIRIAALSSQRVPNATGSTVCPKCGLTLNWSVHPTGKIFGMCESPSCINFME